MCNCMSTLRFVKNAQIIFVISLHTFSVVYVFYLGLHSLRQDPENKGDVLPAMLASLILGLLLLLLA